MGLHVLRRRHRPRSSRASAATTISSTRPGRCKDRPRPGIVGRVDAGRLALAVLYDWRCAADPAVGINEVIAGLNSTAMVTLGHSSIAAGSCWWRLPPTPSASVRYRLDQRSPRGRRGTSGHGRRQYPLQPDRASVSATPAAGLPQRGCSKDRTAITELLHFGRSGSSSARCSPSWPEPGGPPGRRQAVARQTVVSITSAYMLATMPTSCFCHTRWAARRSSALQPTAAAGTRHRRGAFAHPSAGDGDRGGLISTVPTGRRRSAAACTTTATRPPAGWCRCWRWARGFKSWRRPAAHGRWALGQARPSAINNAVRSALSSSCPLGYGLGSFPACCVASRGHDVARYLSTLRYVRAKLSGPEV